MIAAAENNQTTLVEWLLVHGAETDQMEPIYNETALFKASFKGFTSIVTILISNGADVKRTIKNGETCLLWASFKGHKEIVKTLISAGDINSHIIVT